MTGTNYQTGTRLEHRTQHILQAAGWHTIRSPGSKGPADLVALKNDHTPLLIQCKANPNPDHEGWNQLYDLAQHVGARPIWVTWNTTRRHVTFRIIDAPHNPRSRAWPAHEVHVTPPPQ